MQVTNWREHFADESPLAIEMLEQYFCGEIGGIELAEYSFTLVKKVEEFEDRAQRSNNEEV